MHWKYTVGSKLIMQILYLGPSTLTSISSTTPLSWPPLNQRYQITHGGLCRFLWVLMWSWVVSQRLRKAIVFELNGAFYIFKYYSSNMSSQEKHYSIWALRISLGNLRKSFMFTESETAPLKTPVDLYVCWKFFLKMVASSRLNNGQDAVLSKIFKNKTNHYLRF